MKLPVLLLGLSAQLISLFAAAPLPSFDFTRPEVCKEWTALHDITALRHTAEGLEAVIDGEDPYLSGPGGAYPEGQPLWLVMRLKSEEGGDGQVFYFRDQAAEERSAHFQLDAGKWEEVRLGIAGMGPGWRLRIDPPGTKGKTVLSSIRFEPAAPLASPAWPAPVALNLAQASTIRSADLEARVTGSGFSLFVCGQRVADSHTRPLLGYVVGESLRWLDLHGPNQPTAQIESLAERLKTAQVVKDSDDGTWRVAQTFSPGRVANSIDVEVTITVDREREVAFLPLLLLVANRPTGETSKQQGLFAGLEYLENEPSSSEADLIGPEAKRQVPTNHKITFPLMAILKGGRYAGVVWDHRAEFSALYDTPDRTLKSGGHLMGVFFPGSDGYNRREGELLPTRPEKLAANRTLTLKAQLIGGTANNLVPAVQQYVGLRGLPAVPGSGYSLGGYVSLAAHGWLDSKGREGNHFRHAFWPGFGAQPAADAAVYMNWLGGNTEDASLRGRLDEAAAAFLSQVRTRDYLHSAVGHVRYPAAPLVYGATSEAAAAARVHARSLLRHFSPDGSVPYRKNPKGEDYGRTHFAPEANGLTAQVVGSLLEAAAFCGDRALIEEALQRLRALDRFRNTVPRGAQTWEVPLHTPDILASAYLARAYTIGYELTGEKELLEQALYWAWTGVPFVYLIPPVGVPDRPYGTIAVYGATSWRAPVWFGRPVQWCGLVYADALYRLLRHDPNGPWKQLADGITSVGISYTWPETDANRQGLLPDVWQMVSQKRDGPAINPGTVQANAARLFGKGGLYDFRVLDRGSRLVTLHAPGEISVAESSAEGARFSVAGWPRAPYFVLVNGLGRAPQVKIDGKPADLSGPHQHLPSEGWLILKVTGQPRVELRF